MSLKTQNPAACARPAWCRPAIGTNPRFTLARHDRIAGDERGADDVAGRLEHALERRRIAGVEQAFPGRRARDDEIHVGGILEQLELGAGRGPRRELQDAPVEALRDELAPEHVVAVRAEGVAVRKSVAGDPLAGDDAG